MLAMPWSALTGSTHRFVRSVSLALPYSSLLSSPLNLSHEPYAVYARDYIPWRKSNLIIYTITGNEKESIPFTENREGIRK